MICLNTTNLGLLDPEDAGIVGLQNVSKYTLTMSHDRKELNHHNSQSVSFQDVDVYVKVDTDIRIMVVGVL